MAEHRLAGLDRLLGLAETLAGAWSGRARSSTSVAQERAVLRLFGAIGLDHDGQPLASAALDRYVGSDRARLAAGIALPFAMAALEYDVQPQELALDVAGGAVDLAMEAELLRLPDKRAAAAAEAHRLVAAAYQRIDANRTARRELLTLLGDAGRPWLGVTISAAHENEARRELARRIGDGADLVRIRVPASRELAERLRVLGTRSRTTSARPEPIGREASDDPPAGSQRALSALREAADQGAAERGRYIRLATSTPALGAPEQALVAGFERVDIVEADPINEIVESGVEPDRALADHAFARRLHRRSGCLVLLGPGPLIVAPDLARGLPSDPATRTGRALALAAVGVELARADGLRDDQIILGAVPAWVAEERDPATQAMAQVVLRRLAFPELALAFEEPELDTRPAARWPFLFAAAVSAAGNAALVFRRGDVAETRSITESTRAAAEVGAELAQAGNPLNLRGPAADHADAALSAAVETLRRLADDGWRALLTDTSTGRERSRLGAETVVDRTESFDPLGSPGAT